MPFASLTNVVVSKGTVRGARGQVRDANVLVVSKNSQILDGVTAECLNVVSSTHQNDINELKKIAKYPEFIDKISERILRAPQFSNLQNTSELALVCVVFSSSFV